MKPRNGATKAQSTERAAVVGYIRVSSASQDAAYQRHAIEAAAKARGETIERWHSDVASGGTMDRPALERLRLELGAGAVRRLWVWRLDRLSRSGVVDTISFVQLVHRSGATLASVADPFALEDGPAAELVLLVLAWAAQVERQKIRENQDAARARMAAEGRAWGRPAMSAEKQTLARELLSQGKSRKEVARALEISRSAVDKIARPKTRQI